MADIGVAVPHHDLLAVGAAGLIGMPDQAHVPGVARFELFGGGHAILRAAQPLYSTM